MESVRPDGGQLMESLRADGGQLMESLRPDGGQLMESLRPDGGQLMESLQADGGQLMESLRPDGGQLMESLQADGGQLMESLRPDGGQLMESLRPDGGQLMESLRADGGQLMESLRPDGGQLMRADGGQLMESLQADGGQLIQPDGGQLMESLRPDGGQLMESLRADGGQLMESLRPDGGQLMESLRPDGGQLMRADGGQVMESLQADGGQLIQPDGGQLMESLRADGGQLMESLRPDGGQLMRADGGQLMESLPPDGGQLMESLRADGGHLMELLKSCSPQLQVWVIEYVWAHKMMDIQQVVDASHWPELDSQPLSLEDSWRLRVMSAQVYCIMRNRDVGHFERVMGFLEATYRLLPRLVAPIKHMKIIFGLKTMVIMWMLREGRGMVDTVFKIIQFFPSKLPQYQDQCSQHEMFLMRKNHLDFKGLAQTLAVDKDKLEDYIKNHMEEQYGEHYAQKVEDRLLHYLRELETVLPRDTYIDKILKKESPVTEEEKLLLEVITSDSTTIATTLQKLLHCDVASCRPISASQKSEHGAEMGSVQLPKSVLYASSSEALLRSQVIRGKEAAQDVYKDNHFLLLEEEECNLGALTLGNGSDGGVKNVGSVLEREEESASEEKGKVGEEESGDKEKEEISQRSSECSQEVASSPQFCSKHQRWVKSILRECPDECSEELLLQANVSLSPVLFQSSSSTSSSQDLTPSDLIPSPPNQQHPPSQTSNHLLTAAQASEQGNPEGKLSSGPPGSANSSPQMEPLPQPSSSKDTLLPALLSPVVRLIDIASVRGICPTFKPHEASPNHFTMSSKKQAASTSSPQVLTSSHRLTSGNKESTFDQPETVSPTNPPNTTYKVQTAPVSQDASASTSCQPPTRQPFSRLSRKFRQACAASRHSQALDGFSQNPLTEQFRKAPTTFQMSCLPLPDDNVSWPPTHHASTSAAQSGNISSICTANQIPLSTNLSTNSSRQVVPQNSIKPHPQTHTTSRLQSKTLPCATVVSCTSNSDYLAVRSETSRAHRAQLRLSLQSQAVLLHSKLLQPYVSLTRLSMQECHRLTEGRSSIRRVQSVEQGSHNDNNEERRRAEEEDSSFDLNTLYSSHSSSSDSDSDPDYKPRIKKKRLLLEYVTAVSLNHI